MTAAEREAVRVRTLHDLNRRLLALMARLRDAGTGEYRMGYLAAIGDVSTMVAEQIGAPV